MITWREIESRGSSKTKHAEVRAKLAADVEAFLASGGQIVSLDNSVKVDEEIINAELFIRMAGMSQGQYKSAIAYGEYFGVPMPIVRGYMLRGRVREGYFNKSDVLKFIELNNARGAEVAA